MSSIKARLHNARHKLMRRSSAHSTTTRSLASSAGSERRPLQPGSSLRRSISLSKLPEAASDDVLAEGVDARMVRSEMLGLATEHAAEPGSSSRTYSTSRDRHSRPSQSTPTSTTTATTAATSAKDATPACPELTLEEPTPIHPAVQPASLSRLPEPSPSSGAPTDASDHPSPQPASISSSLTPPGPRRPSAAAADASIVAALRAPDVPHAAPTAPTHAHTATATANDYFSRGPAAHPSAVMLHRKIWVKRPNASATLVQIREDDLVDDVREMILKKYANSLGRSFDSPDVTLRIVPRDAQRGQDRTLGPEEEMCRTLDAFFPGGQKVTEALIIDVPQRRTPKPSPQVPLHYRHHDDGNNQYTEYFPPMPVINPSPAIPGASTHEARIPLPHAPHSIAVLNTGQLPPLPSPGGTRRGPLHSHRPKYPRHNTASPTTLTGGIPSSATSSRPPNRPRHD